MPVATIESEPEPSLFTPDSELELLFDSALIPEDVRAAVPRGFHIRPLALTDHCRSHLDVLSLLSPAADPGPEAYETRFRTMCALTDTYYCIALLHKATDQIVGVASMFLERKFLRGLGIVAHLEDGVVSPLFQRQKLGLHGMRALTAIGEARGAYKTILSSAKENIPFYLACGFELKESQMARYAPGFNKAGLESPKSGSETGSD